MEGWTPSPSRWAEKAQPQPHRVRDGRETRGGLASPRPQDTLVPEQVGRDKLLFLGTQGPQVREG